MTDLAYLYGMRTRDAIAAELEDIIQRHYYSEDFELVSSVRAFNDQLHPQERSYLEQIVLGRLTGEGSIVDILLCSVVRVPSAVPVLASRLDREHVPNQITRALIGALKTYSSATAYASVERFLDSDQELETLDALASIDFRATLPRLVRAMKNKPRQGIVLHILHARAKNAGMGALVADLCALNDVRKRDFAALLSETLRSKNDPYNPFSASDIHRIISHVSAT